MMTLALSPELVKVLLEAAVPKVNTAALTLKWK